MFGKGVAGEVRFREEAKPGDSAGARKLMPLRLTDGTELHLADDSLEQILQDRHVSQRLRRTTKRFDNPLDSAHGTRWRYACGFPNSGQNLALRAMGLPHSEQNFVSAAGAPPAAAGTVPPPPEDCVDFFTASIMAWPMATPAPSPAPIPTAPPPSLAAATGMAWAT